MLNSNLTVKRILLNICLLMVLLATAAAVSAQDASERQRALDLYESSQYAAALPLLEKVAQANPNDVAVLSRLGFVLYATSTAEKNATTRQQMRDRARTILLRSKSLGDDSNLTSIALDALSRTGAAQRRLRFISREDLLVTGLLSDLRQLASSGRIPYRSSHREWDPRVGLVAAGAPGMPRRATLVPGRGAESGGRRSPRGSKTHGILADRSLQYPVRVPAH